MLTPNFVSFSLHSPHWPDHINLVIAPPIGQKWLAMKSYYKWLYLWLFNHFAY